MLIHFTGQLKISILRTIRTTGIHHEVFYQNRSPLNTFADDIESGVYDSTSFEDIQSQFDVAMLNQVWPMGTYGLGLRQPEQSCPESFSHDSRQHCDKSKSTGKRVWPAGNYCIYRKGGNCPPNSRNWDASSWKAFLQNGEFGDSVQEYLCCRNDGDVNKPIVFPNTERFQLIQNTDGKCQQVQNMSSNIEEVLYIDAHTLGDKSLAQTWKVMAQLTSQGIMEVEGYQEVSGFQSTHFCNYVHT